MAQLSGEAEGSQCCPGTLISGRLRTGPSDPTAFLPRGTALSLMMEGDGHGQHHGQHTALAPTLCIDGSSWHCSCLH